MRITTSLCIISNFISTSICTLQIVPGATWTDVNTGEHLQAHGPGIFKDNDIYYLVGEDKSNGLKDPNANCYSSPNLVEWTHVGALFDRSQIKDWSVIERPKVLYNAATKKYVAFMHLDSSDYRAARVGVGIGDEPCGRYEFVGSWRPFERESRDIGVWQEGNTGYLLSEDRPVGLRIYKLSDDYLSVKETTYTWKGDHIESPALYKHTDGTYFMFGSHLTGWRANDNVYSSSRSLSGPWSPWRTFAPVGSNTYQSQSTFVLGLPDGQVMYGGDRWIQQDLSRSTYVWLPLSISDTNVTMSYPEAWDVPLPSSNLTRREWSVESPKASLSNGAKLLSNGAAGYIGGPSNGTVVFQTMFPKGEQNRRNTVRIYYRNGDTKPRHATVQVGIQGQKKKIAFLSTNGKVGISVFTADFVLANEPLRSWTTNEVVISAYEDGGWGPDVISIKFVTTEESQGTSQEMVIQQADLFMPLALE